MTWFIYQNGGKNSNTKSKTSVKNRYEYTDWIFWVFSAMGESLMHGTLIVITHMLWFCHTNLLPSFIRKQQLTKKKDKKKVTEQGQEVRVFIWYSRRKLLFYISKILWKFGRKWNLVSAYLTKKKEQDSLSWTLSPVPLMYRLGVILTCIPPPWMGC